MWQPTCFHNLRKIGKAKLPIDPGVIPFKTYHPDLALSQFFANKYRLKARLTHRESKQDLEFLFGESWGRKFFIFDCEIADCRL